MDIIFNGIGKNPSKVQLFADSAILPSLNGFRGISILLVIISHCFFYTSNFYLQTFSGYFGVTIFFVISGYLITTLLLREKEKTGAISLKRFYVRRALRIIPVSYLFLLVLMFLNQNLHLGNPFFNYISSFLFIKNTPIIFHDDVYTNHYWTLSIEEQFYIIFPWILSLNIRAYVYLTSVLIVLLPIGIYCDFYHIGVFKSDIIHILFSFISQSSPILIGSLAAILISRRIIDFRKIYNPSSLLNISLLVFAALILSSSHKFIPSTIKPTLSALIIIYVLLNYMEKSETWLYKILNSKILNYLGILSYSLYIWQQIFTFHLPWKSFLGMPNTPLVNVFLLVLVSLLSYHFYEKFFLNLKKKFV